MRQFKSQNGSVLLTVLFVVMAGVGIVAAAYLATSSQGLLTSRSNDVTALKSTGEGVLDYAYGQWKIAMDSNGLMNSTACNALVSGSKAPTVPSGMSIVSLTINPVDANGIPASEAVRTFDYKMAFVYNYQATVTLRSSGVGGKRQVTMRRNLVYSSSPPTRCMFFSQGDFELYKPAKMVIGGDVHTNSNAHVSTGTSASNLTFMANSRVTYVGGYDNAAPAGATTWNNSGTNYAPYYESGLSSQVKKVTEVAGIGLGTAAQYSTADSNPNNDGNRELIEPPVAGYSDPDAIANSRIYNTAGIVVAINGPVDTTATLTLANNTYSGGNISIKTQNGTTLTAAQAATVRGAISNSLVTQVQTWVPNLVWVSSGYYTYQNGRKVWVDTSSWVDQGHYVTTNQVTQKTLYDKRELQSIPISDINLGSMNSALNAATGFNGILYVYDVGSSSKKAIRVTNGGVLPTNGLTIATEDGLYVQGDYNTGTTTNPNLVPSNSSPATNAVTTVPGYTTKSAALVADAVMFLSNGWSDANASSSVSSRAATNTTVNSALVSGYVASANGGSNGRSGYSGGMNNFPRFLETWSGDSMTFSGAFVSLWQSKMFTASWDTGDIYVPPTRYWYFDQLLLTRVIPGIPANGSFSKGQLISM